MLPITSPYRLTIVSFYRHLYTKNIWITYNITYKGSLYFGIPGVGPFVTLWHCPYFSTSGTPCDIWPTNWSKLYSMLCIGNLRINVQFDFHGIFSWRKIHAPKFVHIDLTLFHVEIHTRQGYDLWHCHERLMFNPSFGDWCLIPVLEVDSQISNLENVISM